MKKRLFSLFLVVAILLSMAMPVSATVSTGTCGTDVTWSFDDETKTLTISGNGAITSPSWYQYRTALATLIIEEGVTAIGSGNFSGCNQLTDVIIADSVSVIGDSAFGGCVALSHVVLGSGLQTLGNSAFGGCTSLKSISLPDDVIAISNSAFSGCTSLESISLGRNIESIGNSAFGGCASLKEIELPDSLTSIGASAFSDCTALTSVLIPSNVATIGENAFKNCTNLNEILIAEDNAYFSTDSAKVFYDKNKTNLMFALHTLTGDYTVPSSVNSIASYAFYDCSALTSITISDSVTSIGSYAFYNCSALTSVTIGNGVTALADYTFYSCRNLSSVVLPNALTKIGNSVFTNCESLTRIELPDSVTSIGLNQFLNCSALKSVKLPKNLTSVGASFFSGCTALENVIIPESVTGIGTNAFANCASLQSINFSANVTSIAVSAFNGCVNILAFNVDENNPSYCNDEIGALYDKEKTQLFAFPAAYAGSYTIPESVTTIRNTAFSYSKLSSLTIPESVTTIQSEAFYKCSALKQLTIPDSVTTIGNYLFEYATGITDVTIGNGITTITNAMFRGASDLVVVTLPEGIKTINAYAFEKCEKLDHIFFEGTEEQWNGISVKANNAALSYATVHLETSEEAYFWKTTADGEVFVCKICDPNAELPCAHENCEIRFAAKATCTIDGYSGDAYCVDCGELIEKGSAISALGHSYTYTNNGKNHTVGCANCDLSEIADHEYVDGNCICGAAEATEPEIEVLESLNVTPNISIGAEIQVMYTIMARSLTAYESFYLEVSKTVAGGDPIVTTYGLSDDMIKFEEVKSGSNVVAYRAIYTGIGAKNMGDEFTTILYAITADGAIKCGVANTTSIKSYLMGKVEDTASSAVLKTLAVDMLNYGAAAQINFNYDAENLVNTDLTKEQKALGTQAKAEATDMQTISGTGASIAASVSVQNKVFMYLTVRYAATDASKVKFIIKDAEGKIIAELIPTALAGGKVFQASYDGVGAKQMREPITIEMQEDGVTVSESLTWSVESYVAQTRASSATSENLMNMVNALLIYGDSAAAYLA